MIRHLKKDAFSLCYKKEITQTKRILELLLFYLIWIISSSVITYLYIKKKYTDHLLLFMYFTKKSYIN